MTPKQMQELLPVANAYAQGQAVQWRVPHCDGWCDFSLGLAHCQPKFLETGYEWRVKPRFPVEWWGVAIKSFNGDYPEVKIFNSKESAGYCVDCSPSTNLLVKVVEVLE